MTTDFLAPLDASVKVVAALKRPSHGSALDKFFVMAKGLYGTG